MMMGEPPSPSIDIIYYARAKAARFDDCHDFADMARMLLLIHKMPI